MYPNNSTIRTALLTAVSFGCLVAVSLSPQAAYALSLKSALESAYNTNPRLKSEREALAATDEKVSQAFAEFQPNVGLDYSTGRQATTFGTGSENYSDRKATQLAVEQPLFNGLGSVARYKSANLQVEAGRARLKSIEQEVLLQAISAYLDVMRDKAVFDLSDSNVEVLRKQLGASKDRFDVGEVTRTDVAQSESRLSRAIAERAQAEGSVVGSKAVFEHVVGTAPDALVAPTEFPELPASLDEVLALADANNPDMQRQELTQQALSREVMSAKSRLLPTVSLRGIMRREEGAGQLGTSDYDNDSVTLNVSVPLYQSGAQWSRSREAVNNHEKAKFDTAETRNDLRDRVVRAWQGLLTSRATLEANRDAIKAAEVALDGVKQEQQYGARTVLDVLDAEQELFAARVNYVRAQRNEIVSIYTVLAASGQLTPQRLGMEVTEYDPKENYDHVKHRWIGF